MPIVYIAGDYLPKKNNGKVFEEEIQTSCNEQQIWFHRIKDVSIPPDLRNRIKVSENPYDSIIYKNGFLFPTELKSTKGKSLPFKNIKQHQIDSLIESNTYNQIIPGFLINFRDLGKSFFLQIDEYLKYEGLASSEEKKYHECKINESSISLEFCEVYGTELKGIKKRVKYRWYVGELLDELIQIHGNKDK